MATINSAYVFARKRDRSMYVVSAFFFQAERMNPPTTNNLSGDCDGDGDGDVMIMIHKVK